MKTIHAVPVTHEAFRPYGYIANIADPSGEYAMSETLPAFHRDMVLAPMADRAPIAFGSLKVNKRPMVVADVGIPHKRLRSNDAHG